MRLAGLHVPSTKFRFSSGPVSKKGRWKERRSEEFVFSVVILFQMRGSLGFLQRTCQGSGGCWGGRGLLEGVSYFVPHFPHGNVHRSSPGLLQQGSAHKVKYK